MRKKHQKNQEKKMAKKSATGTATKTKMSLVDQVGALKAAADAGDDTAKKAMPLVANAFNEFEEANALVKSRRRRVRKLISALTT